MTTDPSAGVARLVRRATDPAAVTDGRLLDRFARQADQEAFALLVRRHGPMVLGVCRRVLGNAADADDAFQAAFLVLARKAAGLAARPAVGNWLYGVAVHVALKAKAMAAKRRVKEARAARPDRAPPADDPDWRPAFDRELAALPDKYREPLVLHELEGLPRKAVAARLGIPDGTLSSRLATAKRLLAARLARAGLPTAALAALGGVGQATVPPGLLAAAVEAAGGGATRGVQDLAREVSVMLLVKKLTVGAAVTLAAAAVGLIAVGAAADPPVSPPARGIGNPDYERMLKQEKDAMAALRGTWELESRSVNGAPTDKGVPTFWTFGDRRAVLEQLEVPGRGDHTVRRWYTVNPRAIPAELNVYGENFLLLCRYNIVDDRLTVAFFGRSEVERPDDFTRAAHTSALPLLVHVYRRVTEPRTPGAALERLQGKWEVVSLTADGKDITKEADDWAVVIDGDRFKVGKEAEAGKQEEHTIRLDPAATPPAADLELAQRPKEPALTRAIYEFDGDNLKLCIGEGGKPRPTRFDASAGSGQRMIVLKRPKK
jgi:RNA polymerase sigma factor (sigma-70 family)